MTARDPSRHRRVAVNIPFYNGDDFIEPCITAINKNEISGLIIYVVDNSTESTRIEEIVSEFDNIRLIHASPRLGFGMASNIGAQQAVKDGFDYLVNVNQDTKIDRYCIDNLLTPLEEDTSIAAVAGIPFTYDFMGIESFFIRQYLTKCPDLFADAIRGNLKKFYPSEGFNGACFAIRCECIEQYGLFDPVYHMYGEERDLCRRLRYANMEVGMSPYAWFLHAHTSTKTDWRVRRKIELMKRKAWTTYVLKDLDTSFVGNLRKLTIRNLTDYFRCVITFRFVKLFRYILSDLGCVSAFSAILKSRDREKTLRDNSVIDRASG